MKQEIEPQNPTLGKDNRTTLLETWSQIIVGAVAVIGSLGALCLPDPSSRLARELRWSYNPSRFISSLLDSFGS